MLLEPARSCGLHYPHACPVGCRYRGDRFSADQITAQQHQADHAADVDQAFTLAATLARAVAGSVVPIRYCSRCGELKGPHTHDEQQEQAPPRCPSTNDEDARCILVAGHDGYCEYGELIDGETGRILR